MSYIIEIKEKAEEEPLGCGSIFLGLVILAIFAYYEVKKEDGSTSQKSKTEQVSTQTPKKQSTTSTKNISSSKSTIGENSTTSKSTTSTYNSTSNSYSTTSKSATASNNTSTTSTNISSEYDESYQTYLALSTVLENDGKSLKLCEALNNETEGQEANVIMKMRLLRGTKYYNNALKDLVRCCPKYAKEYSKNGKYFASEAEFFQSYINSEYSRILKAKKKENR